ncbi:hypothetical protein [Microcoleus sp. FACHB-831]|uniref:hypothetical protein n=1 Tax=Microcoleus sp. FACHB-831 TaxID=2692827 RepID=UPI0016891E09|nr:hypothetical protein [Microcoleus sp. FACHB-831]
MRGICFQRAEETRSHAAHFFSLLTNTDTYLVNPILRAIASIQKRCDSAIAPPQKGISS